MPRRLLYLVLAGIMLVPGVSPAVALTAGAALALALGNPFPALTARAAPLVLKTSVVGLGFGISLDLVLRAGPPALLQTGAVVIGTLAAGLWLGRLFRVPAETSLLVASGTGICGGSAIAAVGGAVGARPESMSAALATVFVLNAVGLYLFPLVGSMLALPEARFGAWAALAIHDTSSVVGAASIYGSTALAVATVLKLVRTLWIVPLTLLATRLRDAGTGTGPGAGIRRSALAGMPWFVIAFLGAVLVRTITPDAALPALDTLAAAARVGLVLALFLIGAGLTRATLRRVGGRPFLQGAVLWAVVASATLLAVTLMPPA